MKSNNDEDVLDTFEKIPSFDIIDESNLCDEFLSERCQAQTPISILSISQNMESFSFVSKNRKKISNSLIRINELDDKNDPFSEQN